MVKSILLRESGERPVAGATPHCVQSKRPPPKKSPVVAALDQGLLAQQGQEAVVVVGLLAPPPPSCDKASVDMREREIAS